MKRILQVLPQLRRFDTGWLCESHPKSSECYSRGRPRDMANPNTIHLQLPRGLKGELEEYLRARHPEDQNSVILLALEEFLNRRKRRDRRKSIQAARQTPVLERIPKSVSELPSRAKAQECRKLYLKRLARMGINLRPKTETIYETKSGRKVGLPFATENDHGRGPAMWLGISEQDFDFDFVILLGATLNDELVDFVLPREFLREIWGSLSRDKRGDVKFDIRNSNGCYELKPRAGPPFELAGFLGKTESLNQQTASSE